MRCQRVRYYLSAYCRDELSEGRSIAISEHLDNCPECRREESVLREMADALKRTNRYEVSADFTGRMLNRIAAERFSETRTRAFFPKRTPIFGWTRVVPAAATVCLILTFVLTGGVKTIYNHDLVDRTMAVSNRGLNDSYLTAQPQSGNALIRHAAVSTSGKDWTLKSQLARYDRIRSLISAMQGQNDFASYTSKAMESRQVCCGPRIVIEFPSAPSSMPVSGGSQVRMVSGGNGSN